MNVAVQFQGLRQRVGSLAASQYVVLCSLDAFGLFEKACSHCCVKSQTFQIARKQNAGKKRSDCYFAPYRIPSQILLWHVGHPKSCAGPEPPDAPCEKLLGVFAVDCSVIVLVLILAVEFVQPRTEPVLKLKRSAVRLVQKVQKKQRFSEEVQSELDSKLMQHWTGKYMNLDHLVDTPMGRTVLKGLRKKNADLSFMCGDVCSAAVEEGSQMFQTKVLSRIRKESRFHARLKTSLPKVKQVILPVQVRKKLLHRKFSFSAWI